MSANSQRLCPLVELRAFLWGSVNDNRSVPLNPQAAPFFEPSFFTIRHTRPRYAVAHLSWEKCGMAVMAATTLTLTHCSRTDKFRFRRAFSEKIWCNTDRELTSRGSEYPVKR